MVTFQHSNRLTGWRTYRLCVQRIEQSWCVIEWDKSWVLRSYSRRWFSSAWPHGHSERSARVGGGGALACVSVCAMEDVALSSAGARVSLATSSDERYPAESVTDGSSSTFWMSTGTFPQEFIITLADVTSIQSMRIECYNVRKLAVEHSISSEPINFEPLSEIELEHNESNLQTEDINVKIVQAQHLRFIIRSAYDHFTSVHRVSVAGNIQHR